MATSFVWEILTSWEIYHTGLKKGLCVTDKLSALSRCTVAMPEEDGVLGWIGTGPSSEGDDQHVDVVSRRRVWRAGNRWAVVEGGEMEHMRPILLKALR